MKKFVAVLRRPVFLVVINFFLVNTLFSLLPFDIGNLVYNIGRIGIIFYGGWLVNTKIHSMRQAALAGFVIYFADHVVVKGGIFLLNYALKPEGAGLNAFGGVLASFVLFTPLAMLIALLGGLVARKRRAFQE